VEKVGMDYMIGGFREGAMVVGASCVSVEIHE